MLGVPQPVRGISQAPRLERDRVHGAGTRGRARPAGQVEASGILPSRNGPRPQPQRRRSLRRGDRDRGGRRGTRTERQAPAPAPPSQQTEAASWPRASCQLPPPSLPPSPLPPVCTRWGLGLPGAPAAAATHRPAGALGGPPAAWDFSTPWAGGHASTRAGLLGAPRSLTCAMGSPCWPPSPPVTCPLRARPGLGSGNSGGGRASPGNVLRELEWSCRGG